MKSGEINYELEKNIEVISQLDDLVADAVDTILVDPDKCWQPSDFLPDFGNPDIHEEIKLLQKRAEGIPDTVLTLTKAEKHYTSYDQRLLQNVNKAIEENLEDASFTVNDLANEVGLSRMHLHRKLKTLVGETGKEISV